MKLRCILIAFISFAVTTSAVAASLEAREAFQKGYQLLQSKDYYNSIRSFKLAIKDTSYPILDYSYFFAAQAYQASHHTDEALQVYKIVPQYFKNSVLAPRSLLEIAKLEQQQGNHEAARKVFQELIAQFPKTEVIPEARFMLGQSYENMGQHEDAARIYRNLDLLHPGSDYAEKAIDHLDLLAQKSSLPGYEAPAATIYNLGVKYFTVRNYKRAKEYFTRIIKYYKKSSFYDEAKFMLGRIYLRKGQLQTAAQYFKSTINLNKDSKPEAMLYLALTYGYLESPKAAIKTLEKLVEMYPNSPSAAAVLYHIGNFQLQLENEPAAIAAYNKLIDNYPNSYLFDEAVWLIGKLAYKDGDYQTAYESFNRALKLPAEKASDRLVFWTAKCAAKIGQEKDAIAIYKTTIARYDHSYYGYRAREELEKLGITVAANHVPDIAEIVEEIGGDSFETISHEEKYKELIALGLGDEAAQEAAFLEEHVPLSQKDKANIAKYHAYIMKGKFAQPIHFAEQKIYEATLSGSLTKVDPRLWRFSYPRGYWQYVEKYSKQYGVDPHLTYAVIREESRFKSRALSRSWAHGLMQIIPSTGRLISKALGMRYSRWKLYDPRVNVQMGTYYLSGLIKRFNGNIALALAGYNGGPHRVEKWVKKYKNFDLDEFVEDIPLRETRNYVKKVLKSYYGYKRTYSDG